MGGIGESDLGNLGVPLHNPPFTRKTISRKFDTATVVVDVKNKALLAELIPDPLVPFDDTVFFTACTSEGLTGTDLPPYMRSTVTRQIEIKAPVVHKGRYFAFFLECLTQDLGAMIAGRELFAFPMVPAHVDIAVEDNHWKARGAYCGQEKEVCCLTFDPFRPGNVSELGPVPKFIMLRSVVSVVAGEPPVSTKLVTFRSARQKVGDILFGQGTVELGEGAPSYLVDLGIGGVRQAVRLCIDIQTEGLRTVYDYGDEAQKKG